MTMSEKTMSNSGGAQPTVVLVAPHVSLQIGGEPARPFHYFRHLRDRGVDVHLLAHARSREELERLAPDQTDRLHFAPDTWLQRRISRFARASWMVSIRGSIITLITALHQRRMLRDMLAERRVDIVHEVTPISPRWPSFLFGLGVPLVIGPMNGDMFYPPAFRRREGLSRRLLLRLGHQAARLVNRLIPGKRRADALVVSNERTRRALPISPRGEIFYLVANAVEIAEWDPERYPRPSASGQAVRFIFVGRLVDLKAVDVLLDALARCVGQTDARLEIVGSGPLEAELKAQVAALGLDHSVTFHGRLTPEQAAAMIAVSDVFVFPSLRDAGGAVVMEAMALGKPVITLRWGGPADYTDERCAILLEPVGRAQLVANLAKAMVRMAESTELREQFSLQARAIADNNFDWSGRVDRLLEIYAHVLNPHTSSRGGVGGRSSTGGDKEAPAAAYSTQR